MTDVCRRIGVDVGRIWGLNAGAVVGKVCGILMAGSLWVFLWGCFGRFLGFIVGGLSVFIEVFVFFVGLCYV